MERRLHLFWPLVLIAAGILWILIEQGRLPATNLWALAYLWPFLLIAAGLGIIIRPYWTFGRPVISFLLVAGMFLGVLYAHQLGWDRVPLAGFGDNWMIGQPAARGSGHIVTQSRPVQGFDTIHINYPATVLIQQGTAEALSIEADDNIVAIIRTQVTGHVLEINSLRDHRVYINPTKPVRITITVKDLKVLDFNSAGDVTVQRLSGEGLHTVLDGAGSIKLQDVKLDFLEAQLTGVGSLQATGTATSIAVQVDGFGSFNGQDLKTQDATVTLNGLGSAEIWADRNLNASVNGLGSVNYSGNAQVTRSVDGLGSIHFTGTK